MKKSVIAFILMFFLIGTTSCGEGSSDSGTINGLRLEFPTLVEDYKVFNRAQPTDVKLQLNTYGKTIIEVTLDNDSIEYTYEEGDLTIPQEFLSGLTNGEKTFEVNCGDAKVDFCILITPNITQPTFMQTLRLNSDIVIRDPFMFRDPRTNVFYMIKSHNANNQISIVAYRSYDLKGFAQPITLFSMPTRSEMHPDSPIGFWAPELHFYKGRYYIFATFSYPDASLIPRQTYIIGADSVEGDYEVWSNMTDPTRYCLDGTLYVEKGVPYGIYCDEWATDSDKNGTMKYYRLKDDLSGTVGEPKLLFKAIDNEINVAGDIRVTDGCFLYRKPNGELFMLWSTFGSKKYVLTYAKSDNGKIDGNWIQATDNQALYVEDGGHGMIFKGLDDKPYIIFHTPNSYPERAVFHQLDISENGLIKLKK